MDGSYILVPVDEYDDINKPVADIIDPINAIKATTWTPLAEAMYTANGYFGERGYNGGG